MWARGCPMSCQVPGGYNHISGSRGRRNDGFSSEARPLRRKRLVPSDRLLTGKQQTQPGFYSVTCGRDMKGAWRRRAG